MFGKNDVSDKTLSKSVDRQLGRTGTASSSRVKAVVQQGIVTLSGTLQHEIQRSPIVKAVSRVAGVRRVIDQLRLVPKNAS
jgi:osmotically-inducible protein OsmY